MMRVPTTSEPVNVTMSTSGCVVSSSPAAASPVTTLTTPGGKSAASNTSASANASSGVYGEGFSTTVLPIASAGPSFQRSRYRGKLNGVIAATTPTGSLKIAPEPVPPIGGSGSTYWNVAARSAQWVKWAMPVVVWVDSARSRTAPA